MLHVLCNYCWGTRMLGCGWICDGYGEHCALVCEFNLSITQIWSHVMVCKSPQHCNGILRVMLCSSVNRRMWEKVWMPHLLWKQRYGKGYYVSALHHGCSDVLAFWGVWCGTTLAQICKCKCILVQPHNAAWREWTALILGNALVFQIMRLRWSRCWKMGKLETSWCNLCDRASGESQ